MCFVPLSVAAAEDAPLFRSEVSLVKVDARVRTPGGGDVGGLEAEDFLVFDEGAPQRIAHFARQSDPVNVLLVLDVSPSMRRRLAALAERAGEALDQLRPGDRAGVLLFGERIVWNQSLTTEIRPIPTRIIGSVFRESLGRATYLNEAVIAAAEAFLREKPEGRRAMVVVTDNEIHRWRASQADAIRALHAADSVLNAILLGEPGGTSAPARYGDPLDRPPDVHRMARETGGEVIAGADPGEALRRIVSSAVTRYSLHYPAPEGRGFHRIRIELSPAARRRHPSATVEARSGYTRAPE